MRLKKRADIEEDKLDYDISEDQDISTIDNQEDQFGDGLGNDLGYGEDFSDMGMGGGVPAMEKHSDLLKELTNFDKYIRDKINGWLGLVWSENDSKFVVNPNVVPIMNQKCAAWCVDYLKTYTRDNNIITHIRGDQYKELDEDIIDVVWYNIGTRSEEFGITNNGDILRICVEIQHAANLVLMGAGDGKYSKMLTEVTTRTENISAQMNNNNQGQNYGEYPQLAQDNQKKGLFGKVKRALIGG